MDNLVKSKVSEFRAGLHNSRLNSSNYVLRSASKNNVSRRQGIYSKFLNKPSISRTLLTSANLSRHDSIQSRLKQSDISKLQTSQLIGKKVNETLSTIREPTRNDTRNETFSTLREPTRNEASGFTNMPPPADVSRINGRNKEVMNTSSMPSSANQFDSTLREGRDQNLPSVLIRTFGQEIPGARITVQDVYSASPSVRTRDMSPRVLLKDFRKEPNYQRGNDGLRKEPTCQRDNDGFAIPGKPVQRVKNTAERGEEMKKKTILLLSDAIDILPQMEAFYLLKRLETSLLDHKRKKSAALKAVPQCNNVDDGSNVTNWLQNHTKTVSELNQGCAALSAPVGYPPSEVPESVAQSVVTGLRVTAAPDSVYFLKNWTLVKGLEPNQVKVEGDLYNMHSQGLLEENHVSSRIIKAEGTRVQTSCCIYNLIPPFQDRRNCIPSHVKLFFEGGSFPKNWIEIIYMWHLINTAPHPGRRQEEATGFSRIQYDERTQIENDRMSIRVPAERDGILSEREERILADRERRRVLVEKERLLREVEESEEEQERENMRRVEENRDRERQRGREDWGRERGGKEERARKREEEEDVSMDEDEGPARDRARHKSEAKNPTSDVSRYGRKRKNNTRLLNETENKRQRVDMRKRMKTPVPSGRLSVIGYRTRSALRGRRADSFLVTPKSSRANKYRSRKKTPGPPKGGRVILDDTIASSFNDSDIK